MDIMQFSQLGLCLLFMHLLKNPVSWKPDEIRILLEQARNVYSFECYRWFCCKLKIADRRDKRKKTLLLTFWSQSRTILFSTYSNRGKGQTNVWIKICFHHMQAVVSRKSLVCQGSVWSWCYEVRMVESPSDMADF